MVEEVLWNLRCYFLRVRIVYIYILLFRNHAGNFSNMEVEIQENVLLKCNRFLK